MMHRLGRVSLPDQLSESKASAGYFTKVEIWHDSRLSDYDQRVFLWGFLKIQFKKYLNKTFQLSRTLCFAAGKQWGVIRGLWPLTCVGTMCCVRFSTVRPKQTPQDWRPILGVKFLGLGFVHFYFLFFCINFSFFIYWFWKREDKIKKLHSTTAKIRDFELNSNAAWQPQTHVTCVVTHFQAWDWNKTLIGKTKKRVK